MVLPTQENPQGLCWGLGRPALKHAWKCRDEPSLLRDSDKVGGGLCGHQASHTVALGAGRADEATGRGWGGRCRGDRTERQKLPHPRACMWWAETVRDSWLLPWGHQNSPVPPTMHPLLLASQVTKDE